MSLYEFLLRAYLLFDCTARVKAVEDLRSTADLIGTNAAAALAFDDALNGGKLLEPLQTRPHIRGAALYGPDGHFFSSYLRADLNGRYLFTNELPPEIEWTTDKLTVVRPIVLHEKVLGKILVESDLRDLQGRTRLYLKVTLAIAVGVLLTVYFLTVLLGKAVTAPIQQLAHTARKVAKEGDYSLRAPVLSGKEMRQLSADFNHMLNEIAKRDAALVEARDQLEGRVAERTGELQIEIGERTRAEIALRQSEEMFRTLSATAPVGIAKLDPFGRVTYVNQAWVEMTDFRWKAAFAMDGGWPFIQMISSGWSARAMRPSSKGRTIR